jgi:hypothetical protein
VIRALLASSLAAAAFAACGSDAGPPDANSPGTISLTWSMHSGTRTVVCAEINAISVNVTLADGPFTETLPFSCAAGTATSGQIPAGTYTVTVELEGSSAPLAPAKTIQQVVVKSGMDTALGNVDFAVDATGGLTFTIAAAGVSDNCAAAPAGAGIDGMTLKATTVTNSCEPVTFHIAAGASTPASDYTSDCTTLPLGPCIAQDQVISVTGLSSGQVKLLLTGDVGGTTCWKTTDTESVPSMSMTRNAGAIALVHDSVACP